MTAWRAIAPLRVSLLGLCLASPIGAQGRSWQTTDWKVDCYSPTEGHWTGTAGTPQGFAEYHALLDGMVEAGECDMSLEGMPASDKRNQLRAISAWLESQQFPAPRVGLTATNRWEAYLIPILGYETRVCYQGACVEGRTVYLFEGRDPSAVNLLLVQPTPEETAHELFHAVQYAYPGVDLTPANRWLIEGTAEAIDRTWRKRSGIKDHPLSSRHYDETLARTASQRESYQDETFWRAVSREYTGEADYRFLDTLFILRPAGDGLRQTHQAFGRWGGLDDVYTQVVARHLGEDRFYSRVPVTRLSITNTRRDSAHLKGTVTRIAANAHRIVASVPEDGLAGLRIRFAEDHPALRLVVDSVRYDGALDERNEFTAALVGQAGPLEFLVRVVNVAEDPVASTDRSYQLVVTLHQPEECDAEQLWLAVHPDARAYLTPPEEYQREHEPRPGLHPTVSELQLRGLVNDGGIACAHPLGRAIDPNRPPPADAGEQMKRRMAAMSPEEMKALGRRIAREMQGKDNPAALVRALEAQPIADSVADRGTLIHVFSPNAVYWQRSGKTLSADEALALYASQREGPVVAWHHLGVGGWRANSGAHALIIVPDVGPAAFQEGETYPAVGVMQYSRGEGVLKRSRPGAGPNSSGTWQGLEGWVEQVASDPGQEPWNFHGTVTIERKSGVSFRGTFSLKGAAVYLREECPPNPHNLASVRAKCRGERRTGEVRMTGWFEAPWSRRP